MEILLIPINGLEELFLSLDKTQNIYKPTSIKPKLLRVFTGSLKRPPETLSHHLDASPIRYAASFDWIKFKELNNVKINRNDIDINKAKLK